MVNEPAVDGPEDVFARFFEDQYPRLRGALAVVTRNSHLAEEIAEESFARLWANWPRISRMDDPVGYLYRTALHLAVDEHRRTSRAAVGAPRDSNSGGLDAVEGATVMERALLNLPLRQRTALVLTELLGYDSFSAGGVMGIRAGTVRRLVSQAKGRLRSLLNEGELT